MKNFIFIIVSLAICITSCNDTSKNHGNSYRTEDVPLIKSEPIIDYCNEMSIKSLLDTLSDIHNDFFLGFNFGMNKDDVLKHINKLKTEIKSIQYYGSYVVTYPIIDLTIDIAPGYLAVIDISHDNIIGIGKYFLHPSYDGDQKLISMDVYSFEEWSNSGAEYKWLESRVKIGYNDKIDNSLSKTLIDNGIVKNSRPFVGKNGNVIAFDNFATITFYDYEALMNRLLKLHSAKKNIIQKSADIKV